MWRRILIGVLLTITSSLALPVVLHSVSAPAGGSTPVSLADLSSSSVNGTVTSSGSGCGEFPQEFDACLRGQLDRR